MPHLSSQNFPPNILSQEKRHLKNREQPGAELEVSENSKGRSTEDLLWEDVSPISRFVSPKCSVFPFAFNHEGVHHFLTLKNISRK